MRSLPGLACTACLLACGHSNATSERAAERNPDPHYLCAVRDGEALHNTAWNSPPEVKYSSAFSAAGLALPGRALPIERSSINELWSLPLAQGGRALLVARKSGSSFLGIDYLFALLDASEELVVGPAPIEEWNTGRVSPEFFASSDSGQVALGANLERDGAYVDALLLLAADGSEVGHATLPSGSTIQMLQSTPSGDFVLMLRSSHANPGSAGSLSPEIETALTFARLTTEGELEQHSEPFVVSPDNLASTTHVLLALDRGFLAVWDESRFGAPRGTRVAFQRLNPDGSTAGERFDPLPPTEEPYQDQLSAVFNGRQLGLLWAEDDWPYEAPYPREISEWPRDDPHYYFMLISPDDFSPRSNVLEIERADGLDDPKLFVEDGKFRVYAHNLQSAGVGATVPSTIDCETE